MENTILNDNDLTEEEIHKLVAPQIRTSNILFAISFFVLVADIVGLFFLYNFLKANVRDQSDQEVLIRLTLLIIEMIITGGISAMIRIGTTKGHPGVAAAFTLIGYYITIVGIVSAVLLWKASIRLKNYYANKTKVLLYGKKEESNQNAMRSSLEINVDSRIQALKSRYQKGLVSQAEYEKQLILLEDEKAGRLHKEPEASDTNKIVKDKKDVFTTKLVLNIKNIEELIESRGFANKNYEDTKKLFESGLFAEEEYANRIFVILKANLSEEEQLEIFHDLKIYSEVEYKIKKSELELKALKNK